MSKFINKKHSIQKSLLGFINDIKQAEVWTKHRPPYNKLLPYLKYHDTDQKRLETTYNVFISSSFQNLAKNLKFKCK